MSLRVLTPDQVDEYLRVYEIEVQLPSWERTAILQGLDLSREAAAAGAETVDPGVSWHVRRAVHDRAAHHCEYCLGPSSTRTAGARTRQRAEIDHCVSRYGLAAVGATWETIHHPLNLCSVCAGCNFEKGTGSLPPDDLEAMWEVLGAGLADPAAPLLRFYAQLLEHRRFHIRRFAATAAPPPRPALGAYLDRRPGGHLRLAEDTHTPTAGRKSRSPHLDFVAGAAVLRHHPDRQAFVATIDPPPESRHLPTFAQLHRLEQLNWELRQAHAEAWASELPSDDNRDMWRR